MKSPGSRPGWAWGWLVALLLAPGQGFADVLVFSDGFESGGVQAWSHSSGFPDATPPQLFDLAPEEGSLVATATPLVGASYADTGLGVLLSSVALSVDGVDRTSLASVSASGVSWVAAEPMAAGVHEVLLAVSDPAGNLASASWTFSIDATPPSVGVLPVNRFEVDTAILAAYGDPESGILPGSLQILLDQLDISAGCTAFEGYSVCQPGAPISAGLHSAVARIRDQALNLAEASHEFVIEADGTAPEVRFDALPDLIVNLAELTVVSTLLDDGRGLDVATFELLLDGALVSGCSFDAGSASCPLVGLVEGVHELVATVDDLAGNSGSATASLRSVLDAEGPVLTLVPSASATLVNPTGLRVEVGYLDEELAVDTESLTIDLDGSSVLSDCSVDSRSAVCPLNAVTPGAHVLSVELADTAGNLSLAAAAFNVIEDHDPPVVAVVSPGSGLRYNESNITPEVSVGDAGAGIDPNRLRVWVDQSPVTSSCTLAAGVVSCPSMSLAPGFHEVAAEIADLAGNTASASVRFEYVSDTTDPELSLVQPSNGLITGIGGVGAEWVSLSFEDEVSGIAPGSFSAELDGQPLSCTPAEGAASCSLPSLARGAHLFEAHVADLAGNVADLSASLNASRPVSVVILEPVDEFSTSAAAVRVAGTAEAGVVSVEVNGEPATLSSGSFEVAAVSLHDGTNFIEVIARDASGAVGYDRVYALVDRTPPQLSILGPRTGSVVRQSSVDVLGLVNDLTLGTISEGDISVEVNGVAATVANRGFASFGVPLTPGTNTIEVVAASASGSTSKEISITYEPPTGDRLTIVSGGSQSGVVSQVLANPLVVEVSDAQGSPIVGRSVVFRVVTGNGSLGAGERALAAVTGADGRASTQLRLGDRSGPAANRVRATAAGAEGAAYFGAVATPGQAAQVLVAAGSNQRGAVGEEIAMPLTVVILDADDNPVAGEDVEFTVVEGSGSLEGQTALVRASDTDGRVKARFRLGAEHGFDAPQFVTAAIAGSSARAVFQATALFSETPGPARISGAVLDNQGEPVPEVTIRLRDQPQTTISLANGTFVLSGVEPGHQYLIVDPSTTSRPGMWAALEFELFVVAGVDNPLERPVYILPLDLGNGLLVSETTGGAIEIAEQPGFRLEVSPGSAVFPGGGRSGVISATLVHPDRIPMPPGSSMQPRMIVTIQPVGTLFDPPARLTMPNVDGLAPGSVSEMFSFDHDLGAFVAIGTGTVAEDGLTITSDPGFGVLEAGWHCTARPTAPGGVAARMIKPPSGPFRVCRSDNLDAGVLAEARLGSSWNSSLSALAWSINGESTAAIELETTGGSVCENSDPMSLCPGGGGCGTGAIAHAPGRATVEIGAICCETGEVLAPVTAEIESAEVFGCWLGPVGESLAEGSPTCLPETQRTIAVNDDDDNQNGVADLAETPALSDNDLVRVAPRVETYASAPYHFVSWRKTLPLEPQSTKTKYRVWLDTNPRQPWPEGMKIPLTDPPPMALVEGVDPSEAIGDAKLHFVYSYGDSPEPPPGGGSRCWTTLAFTVYRIDLDVDSDNDNALGMPSGNDQEDAVEDTHTPALPLLGKLVEVNDDDDDGDGIADFADGFGPSRGIAGDTINTDEHFVPLRLSLPPIGSFDSEAARIQLTYPGPAAVSVSQTLLEPTIYDFGLNELGSVRIWRKNGGQSRDSQVAPTGDFIPPGVYSLSDLGLSAAVTSKDFFIETTGPSLAIADQRLLVRFDPDGPSGPLGWVAEDAVRVTAVALTVVDGAAIPPAVDLIHGGGAAWILPEPEMPQLEALILPSLGPAFSFECRLEAEYDRKERGTNARRPLDGDFVRIPLGPANQTLETGFVWPIWQDLPDLPDAKQFFGGNAAIDCAQPAVGLTLRKEFRIRGRNPEWEDLRTALEEEPRAIWYLEAIIRHEASGHDRPWQFSQFASVFGQPVYGAPDGWGLMQVDLRSVDQYLTTRELWDWRANLKAGIVVLFEKVCATKKYMLHPAPRGCAQASRYPDGQRPQAQFDGLPAESRDTCYVWIQPAGTWDVICGDPKFIPDEASGSRCLFSEASDAELAPEDAVLLKRYNGVGIIDPDCPDSHKQYFRWERSTEPTWSAYSERSDDELNCFSYVERVCDSFPADLQYEAARSFHTIAEMCDPIPQAGCPPEGGL